MPWTRRRVATFPTMTASSKPFVKKLATSASTGKWIQPTVAFLSLGPVCSTWGFAATFSLMVARQPLLWSLRSCGAMWFWTWPRPCQSITWMHFSLVSRETHHFVTSLQLHELLRQDPMKDVHVSIGDAGCEGERPKKRRRANDQVLWPTLHKDIMEQNFVPWQEGVMR